MNLIFAIRVSVWIKIIISWEVHTTYIIDYTIKVKDKSITLYHKWLLIPNKKNYKIWYRCATGRTPIGRRLTVRFIVSPCAVSYYTWIYDEYDNPRLNGRPPMWLKKCLFWKWCCRDLDPLADGRRLLPVGHTGRRSRGTVDGGERCAERSL